MPVCILICLTNLFERENPVNVEMFLLDELRANMECITFATYRAETGL